MRFTHLTFIIIRVILFFFFFFQHKPMPIFFPVVGLLYSIQKFEYYYILHVSKYREPGEMFFLYVNHTTVSGLCVGSFVNHILWNTLKKKSRLVLHQQHRRDVGETTRPLTVEKKTKQKENKQTSFVKQKHFLIQIWTNNMGVCIIIESLVAKRDVTPSTYQR
jgi:hypothetical protein